MSESKSPKGNDTEGIDELSSLRAQHVLSASSTMDSVARARDRLDEESKLRSSIRRERRMRIAEMTERVSGMHGAIRKANEILFEEQLQNIEADLRASLKKKWRGLKLRLWKEKKESSGKKCFIDYVAKKIDLENS